MIYILLYGKIQINRIRYTIFNFEKEWVTASWIGGEETGMKWTKDYVSDIRIAYIGGGSKAWAWKLMADLALEPSLEGTIYLSLRY